MRNQKGFALAITLAVLPLLVGLALLLFAALGIMQFNLHSQHACRSGGLRGQQTVAPHLTALMALNIPARKLQLEETLAKARLVTAIASENPIAIAAAERELLRVQNERRLLDTRQKILIRESDRLLALQHQLTERDIYFALRKTLPAFSYLKIETDLSSSRAPRLAVRPDSDEVAPTYSLEDRFEERQALSHAWKYRLRVRNAFQNFLDGDLQWTPSCSVTLTKEGSSWVPKIRKVRSLSKFY